jgi:hypothetical protein
MRSNGIDRQRSFVELIDRPTDFIQQQNELLVLARCEYGLFDLWTSTAKWIACIEHLYDDIGRVDDLLEFSVERLTRSFVAIARFTRQMNVFALDRT